MHVQVGDQAPDSVVLDAKGQEVRFSQFWQESPILLSFLRHFG
jgi:hypothetical protein